MADLFSINGGGAAASAAAPLFALELPGPPRAKARHRYKIIYPKHGKPFVQEYPEPKTAAYERTLAQYAKIQMRGREPLSGPLAVRVFAEMEIPRSWPKSKQAAAAVGTLHPTGKPDWDNFGKISDAFNKIVWTDDAIIVCALVVKRYSLNPCWAIEVFRV